MSRPQTLPEAFQRSAAAQPNEVALRTPDDAVRITWRQYGDHVARIAGGLAALGVSRGDTVAQMLTNRPEFHLAEAGAMHLGATTYSIYNTSAVEQIRYLLDHADTRVVVTEQQFVDRLRAAGGPVEHLLVVENGDLDRLQPEPEFDFDAAWQAVGPDDVLCLIYTSGTTGPPKGVEHTHRTALALSDATASAFPMRRDDVAISYLPAAHAADRFFNHYFAMLYGFQVTSVADPTEIASVLGELRPTIFEAVPRVWEKLKLGVELAAAEEPGAKGKLLRHSLVVAVKRVHAEQGKAQIGLADRVLLALFDRAVKPKLLEKLGMDRVRWALSGASAIAPDVYTFLQALGLPVSEIWGMSECGAGTAVPPEEARQGTVGKALPGVELRLADDGELLLRGPNVMTGYRHDPGRTAEAIDPDGWLHTGDIATIDDEGYVRIIDRKKELIINAAGKNMSPTNIEGAILTASPLIGSVMAIGDNRPYNVALITLDPDAAAKVGEKLGLDPDPGIMAKDERVIEEIQKAVDAGNARLSRVEQVKRFALLPTVWEPGGDELTPTMKLRRRPTAEKYAAEIDTLYSEPTL